MNSKKVFKLLLSFVVLTTMIFSLFSNPGIGYGLDQEEEEPQTITGIGMSRIDGYIDKSTPKLGLAEWADASTERISFLGSTDNEVVSAEIYKKVVLDRVLIGLLLPAEAVSLNFEEIKVTYDINADGKLSSGDVRMSYGGVGRTGFDAGDGVSLTMEFFEQGQFVDITKSKALVLDQEIDPRPQLTRIASADANIVDKNLHAEFSFSLKEYEKFRGTPITILGENFGRASFSVVLIDGKGVGYGYPDQPTRIDKEVPDYAVAQYDINLFDVVLPPALEFIDFDIDRIEVTQAVQTQNNDLRLVANKSSLARVYVNQNTASSQAVEVRLYGYSFFVHEPDPLTPLGMLSQTFTAPTSVDRTDLSTTANFEIPLSWTRLPSPQTLVLRAEVVPLDVFDLDYSDNIYEDMFFFSKTHDLNIYYLEVNEATAESPVLMSDINPNFIPQALDDFRALYPSANPNFIELDWQTLGVFSGTSDQLKTELNDLSGTIVFTILLQILLGADPGDILPVPDQIFGFRTTGAGSSSPAWADYSLNFGAWGGLGSARGPMTLAHEVNHNLGPNTWGRHTPGCSAAGPDANWPDATDQSINQNFEDTIGWNFNTGNLVDASKPDFMSYCIDSSYPFSWVSDYRWENLFTRLQGYSGGNPSDNLFTQNTGINDLILSAKDQSRLSLDQKQGTTRVISGYVEPKGAASFYPSYTVEGEMKIEQNLKPVHEITHYVVVTYADGSTDKLPIAPVFDELHEEGQHPVLARYPFHFWVPDSGQVQSLRLVDVNDNVLDALQSTGMNIDLKLSLDLRDPFVYKRGAVTATLLEGSVENNTVYYTQLQYSPDGNVWYDIGPQTKGKIPDFSMNKLPGGKEAALRVRLTDGFDTTYIRTVDPFSVDLLPPEVRISSNTYDLPEKGNLFQTEKGSSISLLADAYDPQSGDLTTSSDFIWRVTDENGNIIHESRGQFFDYQFFNTGQYKVEVFIFEAEPIGAAASLIVDITEVSPLAAQDRWDEFRKRLEENRPTTDTSTTMTTTSKTTSDSTHTRSDETSETTRSETPPSQSNASVSTPQLPVPISTPFIILGFVMVALIPQLRRRRNYR